MMLVLMVMMIVKSVIVMMIVMMIIMLEMMTIMFIVMMIPIILLFIIMMMVMVKMMTIMVMMMMTLIVMMIFINIVVLLIMMMMTTAISIGYYMYVEAGSGSFLAKAELQSPNMTKSGAGCALQFWYHMYGNTFSDMTVKLNYKGGVSTIFEVSGNKGNKWNKAMIGLGALDTGE